MAIVLHVDGGDAGNTAASPGPTLSLTAGAGETVTICGLVFSTSATVALTGITDNAGGNTWKVSTGTAQKPPNQVVALPVNGGFSVVFVAWCLALVNSITSVTITDNTGLSDFWRLATSVWTGISQDDSGASALFASTTTPGATVNCFNSGDMVLLAANTDSATFIAPNPAGFTTLTGAGSVANIGYSLPGASGNYTAQWTLSAGNPAAVAIQAFSPVPIPATGASGGAGQVPARGGKYAKLTELGII